MYTAKMAEREEEERQMKAASMNNYRTGLQEQILSDEVHKHK